MKKQILLFVAVMICGTMAVKAQQGGFQRRTIEERVQVVHGKIDSAFKIDPAQLTRVDTVFAHYYRAADKIREEMTSGGNRPDFQVMREKMQPITEARDKELKELLGDQNFKKYKEEIEPAMMPRRGPGGGAGRQR